MTYQHCSRISTIPSKRANNNEYWVHLRTCADWFFVSQTENSLSSKQGADSDLGNSAQYTRSKILIVEDNREIRDLFEVFLKQCGFQVVTVSNGLQAIRLFNEEKFDIVLTDICIPLIDGNILAKKMKLIAGTIPVIAVTGTPALAHPTFDKVLAKPFGLELLLETVLAFLNKESANPREAGLLKHQDKFSNRKTKQH